MGNRIGSWVGIGAGGIRLWGRNQGRKRERGQEDTSKIEGLFWGCGNLVQWKLSGIYECAPSAD